MGDEEKPKGFLGRTGALFGFLASVVTLLTFFGIAEVTDFWQSSKPNESTSLPADATFDRPTGADPSAADFGSATGMANDRNGNSATEAELIIEPSIIQDGETINFSGWRFPPGSRVEIRETDSGRVVKEVVADANGEFGFVFGKAPSRFCANGGIKHIKYSAFVGGRKLADNTADYCDVGSW